MHKDFAQYAKALREEPFAQGEYQTLLPAARSKLVDAKRRNLALGSRFDLAYASAFGFALAAQVIFLASHMDAALSKTP